jgi:hypothetical protein
MNMMAIDREREIRSLLNQDGLAAQNHRVRHALHDELERSRRYKKAIQSYAEI